MTIPLEPEELFHAYEEAKSQVRMQEFRDAYQHLDYEGRCVIFYELWASLPIESRKRVLAIL